MATENSFTKKGFVVWSICALFFLYEFLLRTVIGTYQHPVMQDLNLSSFQFSLLSTTIFLFIYGLMQIPVGIIVDSIGLKKSILFGSLICTVSSIGFAYSHSFALAIAYRLLMGLGASFGFVCLLISVHDWMPRRYSAIFIGLSQFIGTLGPMMAAGPLESLSESSTISWRFVFLCLGGAGLIITLLIFFFVENKKKASGEYVILQKPEKIGQSFSRLFTRMQPWHIALFTTSVYFSIEYLSENEGRSLLSLHGLPSNAASYMITTAWIGYAIGCPLVGFLSDMLERRKVIMSISALLNLVAIVIILYPPDKSLLSIALFLLGLSASGQSIGYATIAEQFKKQFVALGFGLNNAMLTIISAINAPLLGLLLDSVKQGEAISLAEYRLVYTILIIISALALIIASIFIKQTYCKSAVDFTYLTPHIKNANNT